MFELIVKNIRRGRAEDGRYNFFYGQLWKMPTLQNVDGIPELLISATVDYIADEIMTGRFDKELN